ncbi:N4-gp56 family major capsid protein [Staphylococcus equorum]|uniref:N4-gp56 family major capsid protein n=1 Tax=Staphylococcus equorum TaxID=246432 RepID=UPI002407EC9F|nr:N4-gp56 family major capsid protein [Staphylococcus equorum]MDG0843155.1 N4-gp56 family major capsid protein [Staphylococcus equorum]
MGQIKKSTQIIPEVLAQMVSAELPAQLRFAQFADVDTTLVNQPGDTVTMPSYAYSGDAVVVAEGAEIPTSELKTSTKSVTVEKIAKGFEITDETLLSAYGDPKGEAAKQLAMGIANGVDNSLLGALDTTKVTYEGDVKTVDGINGAIEVFNDEDQQPMVLFINPKDASQLRKDAGIDFTKASDLGDDIVIKGAFGEVLGAAIYRSRKVEEGTAYLVKQGALKLFLKRNVLVETERYASRKTTGLFGDEHFAAYLYDESKAIKIEAGVTAPEGV